MEGVLSLLFALSINSVNSEQILPNRNISFYCDFPDIPVVWDFQSTIFSYHETLAFLDTSGRFYVDSDKKYKLEKEGYGTRLTIYDMVLQDEGVYACKKFYNQSHTQKFPIEVVMVPDEFRIDQDHHAEDGDLYSLACVANHVKPTPRIWWQMKMSDGRLFDMTSSSVLSVFKYPNSTTKVISSVGVQLNRTIQGASFICHVELQTAELGLVYRNTTQAHTTNALFKPLAPQIYGLDGTLVGGQLYTLRCVSGYANPAATIKWYKDGVSWSADRVDISSFIGYYVTTSYLEINATHAIDNAVFACHVTNDLMLRDGEPPFVVNKTAHVEYTPIIGAWIDNKTLSEGEGFELDCAVKFAKPIANIRWLRNGVAVDTSSSRFTTYPYPDTKWTSLTVNQSSWEDAGAWQCEAYNSAGGIKSDYIHVEIKHKPYCAQDVTYVSSDLGETAVLTCTVRSNPNDNVTISWYFNEKQVSTGSEKVQTREYNDYTAYQSISVQTRSEADFGSFYCTAENLYGETPHRCEIQLLYKDVELDAAARISAAFGGEAQSYVVITCIAVGLLIIVVFIAGVIIMKRRDSAKKSTADSEENWSNTNPNIHMTNASAEGINNNAYAVSPHNKSLKEGSPEHLVNQELQEVIKRSQSQKNPTLVTAEICKSNVEQLPPDAKHLPDPLYSTINKTSASSPTTESKQNKEPAQQKPVLSGAVLVQMRRLSLETNEPNFSVSVTPSAPIDSANSSNDQRRPSRQSISVENLNDLIEKSTLPDIYDVSSGEKSGSGEGELMVEVKMITDNVSVYSVENNETLKL